MIIRILGEGQFRLDDKKIDLLNKIDNRIVDHVQKGDEKAFHQDLARLIFTIKEQGKPVDPTDIIPSAIIVPPEDMSFQEARQVFCGSGLIED